VIAALYNKHVYLRIATGMLLIMLIGLKMAVPAFISLKSADKENSSLIENDTDGEKKAETNPSIEKEKEFADLGNTQPAHFRWFTHIVHITYYKNNYQHSHFLKVASPPPDLCLQSIC
jgi:hypothetical protein